MMTSQVTLSHDVWSASELFVEVMDEVNPRFHSGCGSFLHRYKVWAVCVLLAMASVIHSICLSSDSKCVLSNAHNPLDTFHRNFPIDRHRKVANLFVVDLLQTCNGELALTVQNNFLIAACRPSCDLHCNESFIVAQTSNNLAKIRRRKITECNLARKLMTKLMHWLRLLDLGYLTCCHGDSDVVSARWQPIWRTVFLHLVLCITGKISTE